MWLVRSWMYMAMGGIDRAHMFMLADSHDNGGQSKRHPAPRCDASVFQFRSTRVQRHFLVSQSAVAAWSAQPYGGCSAASRVRRV